MEKKGFKINGIINNLKNINFINQNLKSFELRKEDLNII